MFAEHAIYEALFDHWQGRKEQARRRVLDVVRNQWAVDLRDSIFWDERGKILVDHGNLADWTEFDCAQRAVCRHSTFKLGVLLYAIRLLDLEQDLGDLLTGMRQRLWDAQHESGGLAHFIDVHRKGPFIRGNGSTGEATSIAILSETVMNPLNGH